MIFLIWIEEGGRRDMLKGIIVREEEDLPCVGARTGRDLSVRGEDFEGEFEGWRGFEWLGNVPKEWILENYYI